MMKKIILKILYNICHIISYTIIKNNISIFNYKKISKGNIGFIIESFIQMLR